MAKESLKEIMAAARVASDLNDTLIDVTLEHLEKPDLTEESRMKELDNLRKGLDNREGFHNAEMDYREIQAEKKGFIIGWASATVGAVVGVIGPKAFEAIKNHLKKN